MSAKKADIESAKAAIQALNQQWEINFENHDTAGLVALFTEDCVRMPQGGPATVGRPALEAAYRQDFAEAWKAQAKVRLDAEEIIISGEYAFAHGTDTLVLLNFDKIMFTELIECHNRGMRPYGTSDQLKKRREEALQLLKGGVSVDAVAAQMGVNPQSVRRWRREQKHPKEKSERAPGRAAYLTEKQIKKLEKELLRGAYAHGYSEDYWTLDRIGHVIWTLFGVRYEPSGVWRLMTRIGWSSQKVQRLAIQRDDAEIANWKRRVWPRIKKVA